MANKKNQKKKVVKKKDVKMEVEEQAKEEEKVIEKEKPVDLANFLRDNISLLNQAVELDDKNLIRRVWRKNTELRRNLSLYDFQAILGEQLPPGSLLKNLLSFLDKSIAVYEKQNKQPNKNMETEKETKSPTEEPLLEVEAYLTLFIITSLMKSQMYSDALELSKNLLHRFSVINRQTLDSFLSKTYYYYSLCSEKLKNSSLHYDEELLQDLITGHKTSSLRLYEQAQATIINLILRYYLTEKRYGEARMFLDAILKDGNPVLGSSNVGNNEQIRFLYYSGKAAAVEANYSESDIAVTRAIRKSPTNTGLGFRLTIHKLNIVTKLLMGEVPERALFQDLDMKKELDPYFHLVQSVRNGSVDSFDRLTKKNNKTFERDDLMTLINRLRSSVVKTALRNINLAYSKISFKDVMQKLLLKTAREAELVCAKAIRDGIIENAVIDSASKSLINTETVDVYSSTLEPKEQFDNRINFCLNVHNSALKAHKYPPDSHKPKEPKLEKIAAK